LVDWQEDADLPPSAIRGRWPCYPMKSVNSGAGCGTALRRCSRMSRRRG